MALRIFPFLTKMEKRKTSLNKRSNKRAEEEESSSKKTRLAEECNGYKKAK